MVFVMSLKDKLFGMVGNLDLLAVFCVIMAIVSYFLAWAMAGLWLVVAVLWQVGKAQKIKAGLKDLAGSFSKPAAPVAPVGVQPVAG